nr:hypothetical protein [Pseudomonas sp.]
MQQYTYTKYLRSPGGAIAQMTGQVTAESHGAAHTQLVAGIGYKGHAALVALLVNPVGRPVLSMAA